MAGTGSSLTPLLAADELRRRVAELAAEIEAETPADTTLHLVGMLTGGFMFLADLARAFSRPVTIDFVRGFSYGSATATSGAVTWRLDPAPVTGRDVLIVEDIVDTGTTLRSLRERLLAAEPRSLRCVCLLDKPARRRHPVPVEFVGFTIDDLFVVGYGLDHAERYRQLPYIAALPAP